MRVKGITRAWKRSVHATHFSSGLMVKSLANSSTRCVCSSVRSSPTDLSARFLSCTAT